MAPPVVLPVAPPYVAPTRTEQCLLRFVSAPSGMTLDFKKLKKDVKINTKRHFSNICVMAIDSKGKGRIICCLIDSS